MQCVLRDGGVYTICMYTLVRSMSVGVSDSGGWWRRLHLYRLDGIGWVRVNFDRRPRELGRAVAMSCRENYKGLMDCGVFGSCR